MRGDFAAGCTVEIDTNLKKVSEIERCNPAAKDPCRNGKNQLEAGIQAKDQHSSNFESDTSLLAQAQQQLTNILIPDKHFVVAAIRGKSGKVYIGFNLKTTATRASICAEGIALAKAIESGEIDIDALIVVAQLAEKDGTQKPVVVTPCGICRELLYDYAPNAYLIRSDETTLSRVPIKELLVLPYKR